MPRTICYARTFTIGFRHGTQVVLFEVHVVSRCVHTDGSCLVALCTSGAGRNSSSSPCILHVSLLVVFCCPRLSHVLYWPLLVPLSRLGVVLRTLSSCFSMSSVFFFVWLPFESWLHDSSNSSRHSIRICPRTSVTEENQRTTEATRGLWDPDMDRIPGFKRRAYLFEGNWCGSTVCTGTGVCSPPASATFAVLVKHLLVDPPG